MKIIFLFISLVSLTALAQVAAAPAPAPSAGSVILGFMDLVKSWSSLGVYTGIALALKLLVDATKALGLFEKIPGALQSSFVLLISAITVGLTSLAAGATPVMALSAVLGSSAAAMLMHEWLDDVIGWVKVKLEKKQSPPAV